MPHSRTRSNDAPSAAAIAASIGKRVLVIDDDEAVRTSLCAILTARGYSTVEAENGAAALSYVREAAEKTIDAVVLDMQMPGMNGRDVLTALRAVYPELPIVMASGLDLQSPSDAPDLRLRFIQKALGPQALLTQLSELLQADA